MANTEPSTGMRRLLLLGLDSEPAKPMGSSSLLSAFQGNWMAPGVPLAGRAGSTRIG